MSEEIVGKAIKKYEIPRHKIVVLTKCWGTVAEEMEMRGIFVPEEIRASKDYVNTFGMYSLLFLRSILPLVKWACRECKEKTRQTEVGC